MQQLDDRLLLSATDLIDHLECAHLTRLNLEVATGRLELEPTRTDASELVAKKGTEHELAHLAALRATGREVVDIGELGVDEPQLDGVARGGERGFDRVARAAEGTREAMREGAEVIYQGSLFAGARVLGVADFLERVERPSDLCA